MDLAWVDRQSVRRFVVSALREADFSFGDVVALDALLDPCLEALQTSRLPAFDAVELRSPAAIPAFRSAFDAAVHDVAGSAYAGAFDEIVGALDAIPVSTASARAAREPLDDVDVVIEGWVERIAVSDRATALHSRAVGAGSHRIGLRLGLDGDQVIHATRCGTIHDVGKMLTPVDLLIAPRALSLPEWDVMQRHVIDGWNIVTDERQLAPFSVAVRGHHERFDGRGYPDGLAGERIGLATRIVTVADAFNAMIAVRPYRPAMSPMLAISELERYRGTQFDPDCVDAMVDVVLGRV